MPMPRPGFCWANVLRSCGRSLSASPMSVLPRWKNCSPWIEVTGTTDSRLGRRIREPVTTILVSDLDAPWGLLALMMSAGLFELVGTSGGVVVAAVAGCAAAVVAAIAGVAEAAI